MAEYRVPVRGRGHPGAGHQHLDGHRAGQRRRVRGAGHARRGRADGHRPAGLRADARLGAPGQVQGIADRARRSPPRSRPGIARRGAGASRSIRCPWPTAATARSTPPSPPGYTRVAVPAQGPDRRAGDHGVRARATAWRWSRWPTCPASRCCCPTGSTPLTARALGTGEVVRAALDAGCRRDRAGHRRQREHRRRRGHARRRSARGSLDADGHELGRRGGAALDAGSPGSTSSGLHPALAETRVVVASDVDNPLLGPTARPRCTGRRRARPGADVAVLDGRAARLVRRGRAAVGAPDGRDPAAVAGRGRRRRGRLRRHGRARRRAAAGHRAGARPRRLRRPPAPAPTWWSPARARWTSRPCTARPRPGWLRRPGGRIPVVAVAGRGR